MKVVVDFGEGTHIVLDIDKVVVKPGDCVLIKQLADGTPLVAGIDKKTAAKYSS